MNENLKNDKMGRAISESQIKAIFTFKIEELKLFC